MLLLGLDGALAWVLAPSSSSRHRRLLLVLVSSRFACCHGGAVKEVLGLGGGACELGGR